METLVSDIRFALRQMWLRPGFSALLVFVLALGIGSTGAMFAVVRGVLMADLPFPQPDRIVSVSAPQPEIPRASASGPDFSDWHAQSTSFDALSIVAESSFNVAVGDQAVRISGAMVTGEYFDVLGVDAASGRVLTDEDEAQGARVAVISERLHREQFGADPTTLGRTVIIDGEPHEIVGILPPGHRYVGPYGLGDLWKPLGLEAPGANPMYGERGSHMFRVLGRLRDGVSVASADAELKTIAARLQETYPKTNTGVSAEVIGLKEMLVERSRDSLLLLFGAIVFVLLLTCANAANLLLVRAAARRSEIAMRAALGASRGRLVRQLLTEAVVVSLVGGAAGLLVALWALDLFVWVLATMLPSTATVTLDPATLAVTIGAALIAGVLAGIAPAIATSRPEAYTELKEGAARATAGKAKSRLRLGLVVAEISIAIALLAGAGLLMKSYVALEAVDPGFDPERVETAAMVFPRSSFVPEKVLRYQESVLGELGRTHGVESAAVVDRLPQGGWSTNGDIEIEGREPFGPGESPVVERRRATPGYFEMMNIRMIAGRTFHASDDASGAPVMIVNEAFAKRFFPGEDAIGKRARWNTDQLPYAEIIGVYADVKSMGPDQAVPLESFIPFAQHPDNGFAFVVKVAPGADGQQALRDATSAVDPMMPPIRIRSMEAIRAGKLAGKRSIMVLLAAFAAVAVVLAALGIYGVVAHQTAQRTREVGIRLALGAKPRDVVALVVGQSMVVVGVGIAVGLGIAIGGGRVIAAFLFGTSALDPTVYAGVVALVGLIGLGASAIPALRAAGIAPATALRYE